VVDNLPGRWKSITGQGIGINVLAMVLFFRVTSVDRGLFANGNSIFPPKMVGYV